MKYRRATFHDVESIHKIVNSYAEQGLMLGRSRNVIYETLRDFVLADEGGRVAGVGALHLVWDELAEIRAMAISPDYVGKGVGMAIVQKLTDDARELGVKTLFALTYQPVFLPKQGFMKCLKSNCRRKSGKIVSIAVNSPIAMRSPWCKNWIKSWRRRIWEPDWPLAGCAR